MSDNAEERKVYRVTMKCITTGCLHGCTASLITYRPEPNIGSPYGNIKTCLLHDEICSWRVASYEEVPELTAILGRRKGE